METGFCDDELCMAWVGLILETALAPFTTAIEDAYEFLSFGENVCFARASWNGHRGFDGSIPFRAGRPGRGA